MHRSLFCFAVIGWHISSSWILRLFIKDQNKLRYTFLKGVSSKSKLVAKILRLDIQIENPQNARPNQNYLIVANHLSYLDAILMTNFRETSFVTSMEIRSTPVLGIITELGGCLYVERRSRENIHLEIAEIENALKAGFNVTVFPEATSTNGEKVLPFKRPLFLAALRAKVPVLPIVIQYESIDDEAVTKENRDALCWYGDMGFGKHFLKLNTFRKIKMKLKILPEISIKEDSTRDTLMEEAFQKISQEYVPIR
jgi:1-acyl-sn-glycerol-3-phosphate acyltransferase